MQCPLPRFVVESLLTPMERPEAALPGRPPPQGPTAYPAARQVGGYGPLQGYGPDEPARSVRANRSPASLLHGPFAAPRTDQPEPPDRRLRRPPATVPRSLRDRAAGRTDGPRPQEVTPMSKLAKVPTRGQQTAMLSR